MRKLPGAAIVVAAAVTLTACTAAVDEIAATPASSASPTAGASVTDDADRFERAPAGVIDEDSGETHGPRPVPIWDEASRGSAVAAAETAMTAYARPDLSFEQWWAGVQPLLDQQATQDYAYMDPARLVASTVTGAGVITDDTSAYVAFVDVPTNAGTYRVVVSRLDADAPWLTSRFIVPEGVN